MTTILSRQAVIDVASAIRDAACYLEQASLGFGQGTAAPIDDAAWIVLESVGQSPVEPPDYQQVLTAAQISTCESWLRQRAEARVPVAYLVGRTWFAGMEFKADPRALVPRSPIAELIQGSFAGLVDTSVPFSLLDLCTGGGCIALASAYWLPNASVHGTDLSAEALALAAENRALHGLEQRVDFFQGDLFAPVSGQFEVIVSNPPYVDAADLHDMPAEFNHEPSLGLAAGEDGLDLVHRILREAPGYLTPQGVLIVEVGNSAPALEAAYPNLPFEWFDFERGGDGVFMLHRSALLDHAE